MFDVKLNGSSFVCTQTLVPDTGKFLKPFDMKCTVAVQLGYKPKGEAGAKFLKAFDTEFNALVKAKTGNWQTYVQNTAKAIGKMADKYTAAELEKSSIIKDQEKSCEFCGPVGPRRRRRGSLMTL